MNFYFEIYTRDPVSDEGGHDIVTGYIANSESLKKAAKTIERSIPLFDEIISLYESNVPEDAELIIDASK